MGSCFGLGRWKCQRRNIRTWPSVGLCSTPTPAGKEGDESRLTGDNTDDRQEDGGAFVGLDSGGNDVASPNNGASRSGGRMAGRASSPENSGFDPYDVSTTSTKVGSGKSMTEGRLRLKWGIDLDIQVAI